MRGDFRALNDHKDILKKQKNILDAFKNYDFAFSREPKESEHLRNLLNDFEGAMSDEIKISRASIEREKRDYNE
jgi:hypothetical protein